jgi:hypothetical protein
MNLAKIFIYQAGSSALALGKFNVGLCQISHKQFTVIATFG